VVDDESDLAWWRAAAADFITLMARVGAGDDIQPDQAAPERTVAWSFTQLQFEHLGAIGRLSDAGLHRSTLLHARSCFDGLMRLFWISEAPRDRAKRWAAFEVVEALQLKEAEITAGVATPEEASQLQKIAQAPVLHQFLNKRGRGHLQHGHELTGADFVYDWCPETLSQISERFGFQGVYHSLYSRASSLGHFGPAALGRHLGDRNGALRYRAPVTTPRTSVVSYVAALPAAWECARLMAEWAELGWRDELHEWVERHGTQPEAARA
jgi:hypothetical protein